MFSQHCFIFRKLLQTRSLINLKLIGFTKTGHNVAQDSSTTQESSQTPLATIMSTNEAGNIEAGCFRSIVSFLKI